MALMLAVELGQIDSKDRAGIDPQVQRILQHLLFHQSKRLPFLRPRIDKGGADLRS
jgi:hypothetical protein